MAQDAECDNEGLIRHFVGAPLMAIKETSFAMGRAGLQRGQATL
jgi:hypothetical protein